MHTNLLGRRAVVRVDDKDYHGEVVGLGPCGEYGTIYVMLLFDNGRLQQHAAYNVRIEAPQQEHPFR